MNQVNFQIKVNLNHQQFMIKNKILKKMLEKKKSKLKILKIKIVRKIYKHKHKKNYSNNQIVAFKMNNQCSLKEYQKQILINLNHPAFKKNKT